MFEHNRIFSDRDPASGRMGWFFETREGVIGPFGSEQLAHAALQKHIEHSRLNHLDGGRTLGLDKPPKLEVKWG